MNHLFPLSPIRSVVITTILLACPLMVGRAAAQVNIILDTDFNSDVDDAGTLGMLHALADNGEVNILGVAVSASYNYSPGAIDAVNTYYGRPNIPISVNKNPAFNNTWATLPYVQTLATGGYGNNIVTRNDVTDAVSMYRQLLAAAPDNSVTIVTVGFMTNISDLLDSGPDGFSGLTGSQLIAQKVDQLVTMGGRYPGGGAEHNFSNFGSAPTNGVGPYTQNAVNNWQERAVFTGFEIGEQVLTGAGLQSTPVENPVRKAYEMSSGGGNSRSWDQTALLYATRGTGSYWTLNESGSNSIPSNNGLNSWVGTNKDQAYIRNDGTFNVGLVTSTIESLMVQAPTGGIDPVNIFAWEFNNDGDTEDWIANPNANSQSVSGGTWNLAPNGGDPGLFSNFTGPNLNVDSQLATIVEITMSATTSGDTTAQLFWQRAGDGGFAENRSQLFQLVANGQQQVYRLSMAGEANWNGTIDKLRLDPMYNGNNSTLAIDSIRLLGYATQGDFNLDETVNSTDLTVWENGFGQSSGASWGDGDADADGAIDGMDFLTWQANFGTTTAATAAAQAVPEPSTFLLASALAVQMFVATGTRKRKRTYAT